MKLKKSLVLLAALCLTLSLAACAKTQDPVNVTLEIIDKDGNSEEFSLSTTKTTLGDALLDAGYVSASEHADGLYTAVCGYEANWDDNNAWWQFSKDAEVLSIGMNDAKLAEGDHYELTYMEGFGS